MKNNKEIRKFKSKGWIKVKKNTWVKQGGLSEIKILNRIIKGNKRVLVNDYMLVKDGRIIKKEMNKSDVLKFAEEYMKEN